ncbi:unnamed protein product [Gadus morhua 'NCC']
MWFPSATCQFSHPYDSCYTVHGSTQGLSPLAGPGGVALPRLASWSLKVGASWSLKVGAHMTTLTITLQRNMEDYKVLWDPLLDQVLWDPLLDQVLVGPSAGPAGLMKGPLKEVFLVYSRSTLSRRSVLVYSRSTLSRRRCSWCTAALPSVEGVFLVYSRSTLSRRRCSWCTAALPSVEGGVPGVQPLYPQ